MDDRERHIALERCFNFRDLGGYETVYGRRVRWGVVFRSDALHRLAPADLDVVTGLGLRTVIDLRATAELATDGRFARADEVAFHHVPLFEDEDPPFVPARAGDPEPPPGETYLAIATAGSAAVGRAVRAIAEGDPAVVFHCAAGKDRTGIVAALVLSVLGVPDEVIVADYQLSERSVETATAWARANDADWSVWLDTAPPWLLRSSPLVMQRFLELLRQRHGSVEGYLADAGTDRDVLDALRCRLLDTA